MQNDAGTRALKVKTNLRDLAYRSFTQNLLTSRIRPGQFLSQRDLVAITGIPLAAIREVIPRLEAEKLIETVPQRGLQIANVDLKMVNDVFQLWSILARAAAIKFTEIATDGLIAELASAHEAILRRGGETPNAQLLEDADRLERTFHDVLISSLGNDIVVELCRVNRIKIEMIRIARGGFDIHSIISSMEEQMKIVEALKLRDAELVSKAVEQHVQAALKRAMALPVGNLLKQSLRAASEGGMAAA